MMKRLPILPSVVFLFATRHRIRLPTLHINTTKPACKLKEACINHMACHLMVCSLTVCSLMECKPHTVCQLVECSLTPFPIRDICSRLFIKEHLLLHRFSALLLLQCSINAFRRRPHRRLRHNFNTMYLILLLYNSKVFSTRIINSTPTWCSLRKD